MLSARRMNAGDPGAPAHRTRGLAAVGKAPSPRTSTPKAGAVAARSSAAATSGSLASSTPPRNLTVMCRFSVATHATPEV